MKWLSPLCLVLIAVIPALSQDKEVSSNGWRYEVLLAGQGQQLTEQHGALTHNQLLTDEGQILVSTYQIGVPDYQLVAELSKPFQQACSVMQSGGKYRFHIPMEEFKAASRNGSSLNLPGKEIIWEVELLQVLPPKQDVARVIAETYKKDGADAAFQQFQDLRSQRSAEVYFGEWEVNQLGYLFLKEGHSEKALQILQYNAQAHPNSYNAHDSLGEAYLQTDNKVMALQHYRRSLQINPQNENAITRIKELE